MGLNRHDLEHLLEDNDDNLYIEQVNKKLEAERHKEFRSSSAKRHMKQPRVRVDKYEESST